MKAFRRLIEAIEAEGSGALVTLALVEGSSPREAGARMGDPEMLPAVNSLGLILSLSIARSRRNQGFERNRLAETGWARR